jgi:energy-converting hydrogenase B subunit D
MTALQAVALFAVAAGGTAVALTRDPTRQVILTGFFGLALAVLFFVFQAADVGLSQIVVGSVALPVMALLTLRELHRRAASREREE